MFLPKITQNRAGARHRGSDPSDSTRRPQERYGLNLTGRGLSARPQRDLGGNFRWPTRPGRPAERRSEALIGWMDAVQNHQKSALAHQVFALRFFWRFQALFWRNWFAEKNRSFFRQTKKKKVMAQVVGFRSDISGTY